MQGAIGSLVNGLIFMCIFRDGILHTIILWITICFMVMCLIDEAVRCSRNKPANVHKRIMTSISKEVKRYTKYLDSYLPRKGKSAVFPVDIDNVRDLFDALNNKIDGGVPPEDAVMNFSVVIHSKFVDLRDIRGFVCTDGLFTIQYGHTKAEPFVCQLFNARIFTDDEKTKVDAANRLFDSKYSNRWAEEERKHSNLVPLNHFKKYYLSGETNIENIDVFCRNADPNLYFDRMNIKIKKV